MTEHFYTTAGCPTRVRHLPGDGPPVVLLHGASGTGASWLLVQEAWAGADLWIPDLPGRGTPGPALDSVDALAGWLGALLPQTAGAGAIVVGHSLGGAIGLRLALDAPGAMAKLVLVASSARLRVAPAILAAAAGSSADAPLDLSFAFGPCDPALRDAYAAAIRGVPTHAAVADWTACDAFDVRARLGEVKTPTLVVYGGADAMTPAKHQQGLIAAIPGARAVALEGAGHMLPWEAPAAVAAAARG